MFNLKRLALAAATITLLTFVATGCDHDYYVVDYGYPYYDYYYYYYW